MKSGRLQATGVGVWARDWQWVSLWSGGHWAQDSRATKSAAALLSGGVGDGRRYLLLTSQSFDCPLPTWLASRRPPCGHHSSPPASPACLHGRVAAQSYHLHAGAWRFGGLFSPLLLPGTPPTQSTAAAMPVPSPQFNSQHESSSSTISTTHESFIEYHGRRSMLMLAHHCSAFAARPNPPEIHPPLT